MKEEPEGFDTPEEAARGDIPSEHFRVLGVRIRGNQATVWSLTNDGPPFEWYTDFPHKDDGRWHGGNGSNSLGTQQTILSRFLARFGKKPHASAGPP